MRWKQSKHRSVLGRAIEWCDFGCGPSCAVVVAGVHGDEKQGVAVARAVAENLAEFSESDLDGLRVVVMPLANPDGWELGSRKNANGVDINRNFPTKDFGTGPSDPNHRFYGGSEPASEPETKAIMEMVEIFQPRLIISLHEPMECVNYNGPSQRLAKRLSKMTGLPAVSDIGYPCPGSMGTYYGYERRVPLITLELPKDNVDPARWSNVLIELFLGFAARGAKGRL
ncbi:MAG: DUF2817 domain-containing protein [Armatimonadota bacterium]|nr:DUF2817 domain-containing protein [Armatimonadota bacterium]